MKNFMVMLLVSFCTTASASDWNTMAVRDMETPSGKVYEKRAANFSASQLGKIMSSCIKNELPPEFILYFKILGNGAVSEKSSSVETPVARCFSEKMAALTWPVPPTSPFVFKITMFGSR